MYYNKDLENSLSKIKFWQESSENDLTKLAVSLEYDENLDVPYVIDVEDESFFYHIEEERLNDYEMLVRFLSSNSSRWFYF